MTKKGQPQGDGVGPSSFLASRKSIAASLVFFESDKMLMALTASAAPEAVFSSYAARAMTNKTNNARMIKDTL